MAVETHTQVGTGKRLVREDAGSVDRVFGWRQAPTGDAPDALQPPAVEVVVVTGTAPNIAAIGVSDLRNVYPDPAGFRAMTAPEQALADSAALTEAQGAADILVDSEFQNYRVIRGLVLSNNPVLVDAQDALKAKIAAAATPLAVRALTDNLSVQLSDELLVPELDATFSAQNDFRSAFEEGPVNEAAGNFKTLVALQIPAYAHGGDFILLWSFSAEPGSSTTEIVYRVRDVTDALTLSGKELRLEPNDPDNVMSQSGFEVVTVADNTVKDLVIEFRQGVGAAAVDAHHGRIIVWRLTAT